MMPNSGINISFLGDITLNEEYTSFYSKNANPFYSVEPILQQADYVVGNLECMTKGDMGENKFKRPILTTTLDTLNYLKTLNISITCLAHNHVYDYLEDGFIKITQFLENNEIKYLGASIKKEKVKEPVILSKNGVKIGFLNYVTADTNPILPSDAKIYLNIFDLEKAISDIKDLKHKVDHVAIIMHWGGMMEGSMYPDKNQPKLARKIIDEGADLIIGHHSHTLQPYEIYRNKYIFYSLGNFCFSDFYFKDKYLTTNKKRMCQSIILNIDFQKDNYLVSTHGIINSNGFILLTNKLNNKSIKKISFETNILYNSPLWHIYLYYEKRIYPIIAYFFSYNKNPIKQLLRLNWKLIKKHIKPKTENIKTLPE